MWQPHAQLHCNSRLSALPLHVCPLVVTTAFTTRADERVAGTIAASSIAAGTAWDSSAPPLLIARPAASVPSGTLIKIVMSDGSTRTPPESRYPPLTPDERAQMKQWLDNWARVGPILEEER